MRESRVIGLLVLVVAVFGLTACSSDSDDTSNTTPTRSTPGCRATETGSEQRMTVQPCADLVDGQSVKVYASEFTVGVEVAVTTCAAKSKPGGSGCDPDAVTTAKIGAGGSVVVDYAVKKVLASKDPLDCSVAACVLTVGETDGDERADPVAISFAP